MDSDALHSHWQRVYSRQDPTRVTWYQSVPAVSLSLLERSGVAVTEPILDVGGGASVLVDSLLDLGYQDVTVLDISAMALGLAQKRLGVRAGTVTWLCEDVTGYIPDRGFHFWHDRAVFHFLTDPVDRALYAAVMHDALESGGWAAVGTFAPDGPDRCSGLPACRHDAESLSVEFGPAFELVHQETEVHVSPTGVEQRFAWSLFRKI